MESLTNLASSLPTANLAHAEKDLMNNFKAAALSITTLYKSSLRTSKKAYNSGYAAACQDLLLMIQQGVSAGESTDLNGNGMTIGRIMDYVEARLEAMKSREEEEEEDEEKDREKERKPSHAPLAKAPPHAASSSKHSVPFGPTTRLRDFTPSVPMTPLSPPAPLASLLPPTSPSPTRTLSFPPSHPIQRNNKSRLISHSNVNLKDVMLSPGTISPSLMATSVESPVAIIEPPSDTGLFPFAPPYSGETVGTKRRHSAMVSESLPSAAGSASGSSRRRTRSSRNLPSHATRDVPDHVQAHSSEAMDIEEEGGRERKRVARR